MEERGLQENLGRQGQDNRGNQPLENQDRQEIRVNADPFDATQKSTSTRGFAAMDPERQRRIASEGGRAAHRQGVAHEWSKEEAREAGRKGGQIVSQNREHMSEIGRRGGQRSGSKRSQNNEGQA